MMNHHDWLHSQLNGWVRDGLVTAQAEATLRERYPAGREGTRTATIFSLFGGLLIGAGIIALLAYNWESLGRGARVTVGVIPLLLAQGLVVWMLLKRKRESSVWREGVGAFYFAALGAGLAIIDQTYHLGGDDFRSYALTWALLMLPAIYLVRSWFTVLMHLAIISSWMLAGSTWRESIWYFPLLAAVIPFGAMRFHAAGKQVSTGMNVCLWVLGLSFPACLLRIMDQVSGSSEYLVLTLTLLACVYVFVSELWNSRETSLGRRPLRFLGIGTLIGVAFFYSYSTTWQWQPASQEAMNAADYAFPASLASIAFGLALLLMQSRRWLPIAFLGLPIILYVSTFVGSGLWGSVAVNLYLLALALPNIGHGASGRHLGELNLGVFLLSVLIILRFFDSDLPLVVKGLAFIGTGTGFIILNVLILRQKRGGQTMPKGALT